MIETMLTISLVLFSTTIAIAVIRIILGPSMPDRVIALDMIGVNLIAMIAVVSIMLKYESFSRSYFDIRDSVVYRYDCLLQIYREGGYR